MWFPKLEYPRGQTFSIPHITEFFYAISLVVIAFLAVINTALVGNDVVTELRKNPNNTDAKWWAPSWLPNFMTIPTTPGPCQPLTIPQNDPSIHTNSSVPLFTYALLNGFGQYQGQSGFETHKTKRVSQALPYRSEPLHNCTVREITAVLDFPTAGFRTKSLITCDLQSTNSSAPQALKLLTTFSRVASVSLHFETDNVRNYISESPYTVPWLNDVDEAHAIFSESSGQPDLTVLGILDAIGSDLLKAVWAQKRMWRLSVDRNEWPDQAVVKWVSQTKCTSLDKCRAIGDQAEDIEMWYSDTGGLQDFDPGYLRSMNATLKNYFTVLRDSLQLDLGTVDDTQNVFLNLDAFRTRIQPDDFVSRIASQVINVPGSIMANLSQHTSDEFYKTCTWGWGCLNGTWSGAILNNSPISTNLTRGLPLRLVDNSYPTVFDVDFVCPVFKAKRTGSLLVSVFIGTFTMYSALYGIFVFAAPIFDRKYRKKHGLEYPPLVSGRISRDEAGERQYLLSGNSARWQQSLPSLNATEPDSCRSRFTPKRGELPLLYEPLSTADYAFERTTKQADELTLSSYHTDIPQVSTRALVPAASRDRSPMRLDRTRQERYVTGQSVSTPV